MTDTPTLPIDKDQIINTLVSAGFTREDVETNFPRYVQALTALSIDNYLTQIPQDESDAITNGLSPDSPPALDAIRQKFEAHFATNNDKYIVTLSPEDLKTKIESYLPETTS